MVVSTKKLTMHIEYDKKASSNLNICVSQYIESFIYPPFVFLFSKNCFNLLECIFLWQLNATSMK